MIPMPGIVRGVTGALKYAISRGCSGSRMSNTRSPDRIMLHATISGSTRVGTLQ
jgi:hypothetical protein